MPTKKYKSAPTGRIFSTKKEAQEDAYAYHVAKRLSDQTKKIPLRYIGGKPDEARAEFWRQEPVMQHSVDSIANRYNIDSDMLKYRIDKEGFTDEQISFRNYALTDKNAKAEALKYGSPESLVIRGYDLLNSGEYPEAHWNNFGLDDAATYINNGKVNIINEKWGDTDPFVNEKGRTTYPAQPKTVADGFGIVAAHLKYFKDLAKKDFPNASDTDLNRYALAYYNRGETGGKEWVNSGAKGYDYRRRLESRGKLTK